MKTLIAICSCMLLCCSAVLANLNGFDDFNDNVRDSEKWWLYGPDLLSETNEHLVFTSTGFGQEQGAWIWGLNSGTYTQNWSVVIDAINSCSSMSSGVARIAVVVANSFDFGDVFYAEFMTSGFAGKIASTGWSIDGAGSWNAVSHPVSTNTIKLKIAYDSITKLLSSSYDSGSGYTLLTDFHVDRWNMADSDTFSVAIDGMSFNYSVAPGEIYADNFKTDTFRGLAQVTICTAVELGWFAADGVSYQVQYCTNLQSSNWVDFGSVIIGNGATNYVFDSTRTNADRFYRIEASLPTTEPPAPPPPPGITLHTP